MLHLTTLRFGSQHPATQQRTAPYAQFAASADAFQRCSVNFGAGPDEEKSLKELKEQFPDKSDEDLQAILAGATKVSSLLQNEYLLEKIKSWQDEEDLSKPAPAGNDNTED